MVSLEEIRDTTYISSKKVNRLIKNIDKKIIKAAKKGWSSVEIPSPYGMDDDVFFFVINEYKKKGFKITFGRYQYSFAGVKYPTDEVYATIDWEK